MSDVSEVTITMNPRCQYIYVSFSSSLSQDDNRCILKEGHSGEHIKREIFPPPQIPPRQGWIKP